MPYLSYFGASPPPTGSGDPPFFVGSKTFSTTSGGTHDVSLADLKDTTNSDATLQEDDIVFVLYNNGTDTSRTLAQCVPTGYTAAHASVVTAVEIGRINMALSYKIMGASPDTIVTIPEDASGGTGSSVAAIIMAFRGVDTSNPLDVTTTTASGINSPSSNPPAITPSTGGAWIVGCGGCAAQSISMGTPSNNGDWSATTNHYRRIGVVNNASSGLAMGVKTDWVSGAFDPANLTFNVAPGTDAGSSWGGITIALRPTA